MIKGSLKDVSLPGLLQFLANEVDKNYRLKIERGNVHGDVIISNGELLSANFGLLTGEDALCEFLTWDEGIFWVERLPARLESTFFEKNIQLRLQRIGSFADQASFLLENQVGLNTIIRSSKMFGTAEWQESSRLHPLQREDFLILGWLSGGQTMRHSMREFSFDLLQAVAILYRLVLTRSVEVVRTTESLAEAEAFERMTPVEPLKTSVSTPPVVDSPQAPVPPQVEVVESPDPGPAQPAVDPSSEHRRTTALPIISIDIERLMKATFTISEFGFLALKNPSLDENIRFILFKVEEGKTIESVVDEAQRPAATVLGTYRYCMERGYIANPDSVLPLTADLLLRRTELDQYLLQRRRVTGEALRDLVEEAKTDGRKLTDELVIRGFLSQEDLDTVVKQQLRFAMR